MKKYDREKLESAAGKLVGKHQNKLRDSHPNSTISSSRHQSSSNMNTNSIPSTQTHLYKYDRDEIIQDLIIQDLPISPNVKTLPNRDSNLDGDQEVERDLWFDVPDTKNIVSEYYINKIAYEECLEEAKQFMLYEDGVKLLPRESSPDRVEKVVCNFESLSEEDVIYYVRQFESKYNFTPGAITMINWLMQNPEVNNKNR